MDSKKFNLKQFDMKRMLTRDKTICICARRNSGKSVLVRDIMYHHRTIPAAVVICPTEIDHNPFYSYHIPSGYIYRNFNSTIVTKIFSRQRRIMQKMESKKHTVPHLLFVMDDCAHDSKVWINDKGIREIFTNGRHYKILYITCLQDPMVLKPFMRNNVDLVFLLRDNSRANVKRIFNAYGQVFDSFETFEHVFKACTKDYGCMVINNASKSSKIEDICFHYKAKLYSNHSFKLGCNAFWKYHNKHYDKDYSKMQEANIKNDGKKVRVSLQKS